MNITIIVLSTIIIMMFIITIIIVFYPLAHGVVDGDAEAEAVLGGGDDTVD